MAVSNPRKITMRDIVSARGSGHKIGAVTNDDVGTYMPICRLLGHATSIKISRSNYDDSELVGFIGQFKATDPLTGNVFISGVCWPPRFLSEQIAGALGVSEGPVQFAYDIGVVCVIDQATGKRDYQYQAAPVMAAVDPFEAMEAAISARENASISQRAAAAALPPPATPEKKSRK